MNVGMMMIFSSYGWGKRLGRGRCGRRSCAWPKWPPTPGLSASGLPEHHFNDYSFVPDNLQLMTHLAAKHPDVDVGTAAVILPWHNPLRVAENAAVLDLLSNGPAAVGDSGAGLARREFATFGISMDESRERFDEAAPMIVDALNTRLYRGQRQALSPTSDGNPAPAATFL